MSPAVCNARGATEHADKKVSRGAHRGVVGVRMGEEVVLAGRRGEAEAVHCETGRVGHALDVLAHHHTPGMRSAVATTHVLPCDRIILSYKLH